MFSELITTYIFDGFELLLRNCGKIAFALLANELISRRLDNNGEVYRGLILLRWNPIVEGEGKRTPMPGVIGLTGNWVVYGCCLNRWYWLGEF